MNSEQSQSEKPIQGKLEIPSQTTNEIVTPMIAQFLTIKESAQDCLLFYRMGDFYELFFADAIIAAKILDITLTKRGQHRGKDIPMCGVPVHSHETYLHKLIGNGQKIAICEQLEDPKEAKKRGAKSVVNRGIVRIVTPGTIIEDNLLNARSHNYLCALYESQGRIAISWIDISTGDFHTQKTSLNTLLNILKQIDPGEIILPEEKKFLFSDVIREFKNSLHFLPFSRFDPKNAKNNLCDFFKCNDLASLGDFSCEEISASGSLLDYVRLMQISAMPYIRPLKAFTDNYFMEIDWAARTNLEICRSQQGSKNTLLHIIDCCQTAGGARLMKEWLSAPLFDLPSIVARHNAIDFMQNFSETKTLIQKLKSHGDPERALNRLGLNRESPRDLKVIMDTLIFANKVKTIMAPFYQDAPMIIQKAFDNLHNLSAFLEKLQTALADELPIIIKDSYFIRPNFSAKLDNVKNMAQNGKRVLLALEKKYRKNTNLDNLKIKKNNVLGVFIEIASRHSEKLDLDPDFIHRQTTANTARFTTKELEECARDLMQAHEKTLEIELEIFRELQNELKTMSDKILEISRSLSILDLLVCHADFTQKHCYSRPDMDNTNNFEIIDGRHAVIEQIERKNGNEFIANHCDLAKEQYLWLITGPNMAGKSTFLRQNALIVILAQAGFFVPATKARIGLIDRLFSRVGAADDIARGHSTFMVEMLETSAILNRATEKSFVILDEIGRGTATFDGLSLAHAITEYLHDTIQCRTLFATHYHELNMLKTSCPQIHPMHVTVTEYENEIIFTHLLAEGCAHRSYGIHVARLAGISEEILQRAEKILDNLENQGFNNSIPKPKNSFHHNPKICKNTYEINNFLSNIEPNNLTPREALDCLYQLKILSSEI